MTNPFGNMTSAGTAVAADNLGGGFKPLASNIYDLTVTALYLGKSARGAMSVTLEATTADGKQFRETQYISNAEGSNQYKDKQTGEMKFMPSFLLFNGLFLLLTQKELIQQRIEKRVVEIYNREKGAKAPTDVDTFVDAIGKTFKAGILLRKEDKTKKNDMTGGYENTGEARELNVLHAVFRQSDFFTPEEIINKATEAKFKGEWLARWENQVDDRFKGVQGQGNAGAPTGGFAGGAGANAGASGAAANPFA